MNAGTISNLVPLLQTLIWPLFIASVVVFLRKEVKFLARRFSRAKSINVSAGPLNIKIETLQSVLESINLELALNDELSKAQIEEFIGSKVRGLQSTILKQSGSKNVRLFPRHKPHEEEITITKQDNTETQGLILDVSKEGIGFQSDQFLHPGDVVFVSPRGSWTEFSRHIPGWVIIIRRQEKGSIFEYGGKLLTLTESTNSLARTA